MDKMHKSLMVLLLVSLLVVSLCAAGCTSPTTPGNNTTVSPTVGPVKQYTMATGSATGVYYPIGGGIQNTINNQSLGFKITAITTGASVVNCRNVQSGEDEFATVQNDVAFAAYNGQRDFNQSGNLTNIRGVCSLYPETIQVIVLKSSNIVNITDLRGKRVVVGDRGSGSEFNALEILKAYGMTKDDIVVDNSKLSQALELLKNGQADAAFWTGGIPTAAITDLATTNDVRMLPISGDALTALQAGSPFFTAITVPAGTYKGMDADVPTVSVMAILIVNKDVSEDDVYNLLKAIYDPNAPLKNAHAQAANIKKETGKKGMPIPLHPGAEKYFTEQGI